MGYRKNAKTAGKATNKVDTAQNALMKSMKKDIDELKDDIESKYNYKVLRDFCQSYDGANTASRQKQIYSVTIAQNQGINDQQRIGDQVTLKHIDFNYRINLILANANEYMPNQTTVRVMMFWDNQPTAVNTTGGITTNQVYWPQLLQTCTLGVSNVFDKINATLSEKDWDQRKRFSIIYDKTHTMCPSGTSKLQGSTAQNTSLLGSRGCTGVVRFRKSYKGQKIRYVAGGTIPQNRKLYIGFLSDVGIPTVGNTPLGASTPEINYHTRVIYDDA